MADFTDDYTIIGASGDNFDCDSTGGWGTGGNATGLATNSDRVEGSYSLELTASSSGTSNWYHDLTAGSRFIITDEDFHFWFKYIKGKGANFLVQNNTAVIIRMYFGGTTKYADYYMTDSGDLELEFGWQLLSCSGKELNGGSIGGGHNDGTDWDLEIYRVDLRLNFANSNDVPLGMDCFFSGTKIFVTSGTEASPKTPEDVQTYCDTGRTAFPLGLFKIKGTLIDCKASLYIGDDSSGVGHEGHFAFSGYYFFLHGLSRDVYRRIATYEDSTLVVGDIETGTDGSYAVNGCQIAGVEGFGGGFGQFGTGVTKAYNTNFIYITSISAHTLITADVFGGAIVFIKGPFYNVTMHDCSSYILRPFHDETSTMKNVLIHNTHNPIYFDWFDNAIKDVTIADCTGRVNVDDEKTNTLVNCYIDNSYFYNRG